MPELKIVLYKENREPLSITLTTRFIYKILALLAMLGLLLIVSLGLCVRFYLESRAKISLSASDAGK